MTICRGCSAYLQQMGAFLCTCVWMWDIIACIKAVCSLSRKRSLQFFKSMLCFAGHYVVICGYNADTDSFILQDPAAGCCNITVTSAIFENARKAYGTDEDLLIVPLAERQVASTDIHKVQVYGKTTLCERCCCKTSTLISEV